MSKEELSIIEKLGYIQQNLNAPKNRHNKFGNYNYRSCEDIMEAVKPLLDKVGCVLTLSDALVQVGDRYYIRATANLKDGKESIENVAYAREEETKKGMDGSQITGASSSYARKYALNGLFLIDDVRDSDETNTHGKDGFKNAEINSNTYMSYADDWIFRHPEMKERIFKKYNLKTVEDIRDLTAEAIDEMLTGMKMIDTKEKESVSISGKEETF